MFLSTAGKQGMPRCFRNLVIPESRQMTCLALRSILPSLPPYGRRTGKKCSAVRLKTCCVDLIKAAIREHYINTLDGSLNVFATKMRSESTPSALLSAEMSVIRTTLPIL
jgi:hypothetical protein